MIFISHRGNLNGPEPLRENCPSYIDEALRAGYDVEIDLRMVDAELYLGHDEPQYLIDRDWLLKRKEHLWIHIKDYESIVWISQQEIDFKYFCHESDNFTLTSNGYVWSNDYNKVMTDKCIVPLINRQQVLQYNQKDFYAVCSDYIYDCERVLK